MKIKSLKRIAASVLRTFLLFVAFQLMFIVVSAVFRANLVDEEILSPRGLAGWLTFWQLLLFESTVFTFHRHREQDRQAFLEENTHQGLRGLLKSTLRSADFYIESVGIALLSCTGAFFYESIGIALFGAEVKDWQTLSVTLPALLLLELLAHLSVRSAWTANHPTKGKKRPPLVRTLKGLLYVTALYSGACLVTDWLLPVAVTLGNLGGPFFFLYILAAVVLAALLCTALRYLRAIRKRREFITKLKQFCTAQGYRLSSVSKPYRSLFFQQKGIDFTLQIPHDPQKTPEGHGQEHPSGQVFVCKLVAGVSPTSPIIFFDTGEGVRSDVLRLFKTDLLQVNTRVDYRMENCPAGYKKLVVVLPVPKQIYASVGGGTPHPADTGEVLGDYTLYTATGFLGALERGCL